MNLNRRTALIGMAGLGAAALGQLPTKAIADDTQQLYEAAKKEGHLTWYSGYLNQPIVDCIGQAFTAKYPGSALTRPRPPPRSPSSGSCRTSTAARCSPTSSPRTDASHMTYLIGKDKLVKYTPPNAAGLVPALRDFNGGGYYHPSWVGLVAIMYNTRA